MATHQYRSPSIIVRPTTSASASLAPSASVRKQQQLEHHFHHPRSSPSSSTTKSSTEKSPSVPVHPVQKRSKMSGGGQKRGDQMSDGDGHQLDGRMIKMTHGPFLFVNDGGGDHRVRGRRETRRTEGGGGGSNILGLFANNSKPTAFNVDHQRTPTSSFVIPKTNRQSEPKRIPELQQLQCSFCALSADYHHHFHHHHHNSSSSADDSLTSSSSNSITTGTGTSEDFCSLNSGGSCSCCSCRCCSASEESEESEQEEVARKKDKLMKSFKNEDEVITVKEPPLRCAGIGNQQQKTVPPPPPPPPPKMGLLKNSTANTTSSSSSPSKPSNKKKKGITFQEGGPVVIYREASDSEDEEEFFELSLKSSELNSSSEENSPSSPPSSQTSSADFDEEHDPERIKLRQLTEANTFFNSNYANFKLTEAASVGLGRASKGDSNSSSGGPIKFVIQDGYQQPLPPTKYKAAAAANLKKSLFEEKNNCDNKAGGNKSTSTSTVVKPTSAPPPLPPTTPSSSSSSLPSKPIVSLAKPVIEAKKPSVLVAQSSSSSSPLKSSPSPLSPSSKSPSSSSSSSSSEIPTIRIPRAAINADKLNRSPPPAFANSNSANPLKQALLEKTPSPTATTVKPEKPPKNISLSKPTVEKPAKEASPPPPPANIMKPSFDTTDSALPPPPPKPEHLVQQQQQLPYNSVSLLDENDGTILPLDTQKLPEELKSDVADVRLDQGQLYLLRNGSKQHGAELQQQQQLPEKIPEKLLKKSIKKESTKSVAEDCCFSDDSSSSSASDSGASGCSPSSASPTAQLLEDDRSTTSTSPSPTDSLDSADTSSSPESYESASPELSTSPVPPPPLSPPSKSSPPQPQMSSPLSPPPPPPPPSISPPAQQSSSSSAVSPDSPRNSTMISISYRRSSSNGSSVSGGSSTEPAPVKRNEMLAKLAMDLEQHRAAGDAKKKSTSTKEVTLQQQQQQTLVINQNNNNNNNYIINNNNNRTPQQQQQQQQILPGFADLEKPSKPSNVPLSKREQFLADCYGDDDDDDELTNSKSKRSFFARKNDSSDDSSDSECDPLPDMIKSDEEEEEDDFENISDSDDCSEKKNHSAFGRRLSKDSGATTKSSSSSLGSKQSKENGGSGNKSVSALLRNVVQGSNTKKYTKLMRKNISKTSKFIVNTSKQIGSETSGMVRKLKDKSGGSGSNEKHDNYYYPEEYHHQTVKEPKATKSKSKWTFSPNAQQPETFKSEEAEVTTFQKKKANKFEPMYAFAKSAYKNIEEKMKTSGQTGSKSSSAVGQAELPIDPFGGSSGGNSSSNLNSSDAPALLKIKRLDSSYIEPNYSEPNLLQNQNKVPTKAATVQSESSLVKPPLPPRNYRVSPEEEEEVPEMIASTATVPPPQAPLRRKKLAKKRDQIVEDSSSSSSKIEPTTPPQKAETEVAEAAECKSISSLSQLKAAYESYYRVFSTCQSSIEIFTAVNLQEGGQSKISSHSSNQIRLYRCAHRGEQFYLLSSKNLWTTVYDCGGDNQSTTMTFQDEPYRYLPIGFSRLYDIATFCRTVLYSSSSNNSNQPNNHAHLVESLLLQLFSSLATFEEQCTGKSTGKSAGSNQNQAHKQLSIGDVNDCLVAVKEDGENENALDVILLLPTKELEDSADSGDDSLSMMQSFCLQVFLLRLTSMISNEDGSFGEQQQQPRKSNGAQHYRALVRRNQSGITELRHLYLLGAMDIFKVLPGSSNKRNSGNGVKKMTAEAVERAISGWFEAMQGRNDLFAAAAATGGHSFAPGPVATYAQVQFAADRRNLVGAIELAKRELLQET